MWTLSGRAIDSYGMCTEKQEDAWDELGKGARGESQAAIVGYLHGRLKKMCNERL